MQAGFESGGEAGCDVERPENSRGWALGTPPGVARDKDAVTAQSAGQGRNWPLVYREILWGFATKNTTRESSRFYRGRSRECAHVVASGHARSNRLREYRH